MGDAVVQHFPAKVPLLDRCSIDCGGNNPAADTIRVLDQDFVVCRTEPDRHLEARPGTRDAGVEGWNCLPILRSNQLSLDRCHGERRTLWVSRTEIDATITKWNQSGSPRRLLNREEGCRCRTLDRAVEQQRHALLLDPHYWMANLRLGWTYISMGKFEEAIQALEAAAQLVVQGAYAIGFLGYAYARAGRINEAQKLLKELEEQDKKTYVLPSAFARVYLGLGEIDKGLDWLEKAVHERDVLIYTYLITSISDPLRSHPRYHALLHKMNLEP